MGSKTRLLLAGSMAGLLLLIAVTGGAALAALQRIHAEETALRVKSREHSQRLERVRSAVFVSTEAAAPLRARLAADTSRDLNRGGTASLRGEVGAWFRLLGFIDEMSGKRSSPGVEAWFRQQMVKRRAAMSEISSSMASALDREWESGQAQLDALHARFRWALGLELALVFALGVALAIVTVRRTVRAEEQARALSTQLLQPERPPETRVQSVELGLSRFPFAVERRRHRAGNLAHRGPPLHHLLPEPGLDARRRTLGRHLVHQIQQPEPGADFAAQRCRSEERRVGKECRSRW